MAGFDEGGVFFSDNFASEEQTDENQINRQQVKKRLKDFIRQFHEGNFSYTYRDQLKRNYNLGQYWLDVEIEDVSSFDEALAEKLSKIPSEHLPLFEDAAKEVADEVTRPRPEGEEDVHDVQVMLSSNANPCGLRELKSEQMARLVKIPGIVIAASAIKAKATKLTIQCRSCKNTLNNIPVNPGLEGYALPRKCNTEQAGRPKCPVDPFYIVPDKCKCVDFQVLKLQEAPEAVPNGEMPRHMQLYCDRYMCDKVVPGNRVTVVGIYSIKKTGKPTKGGGREKVNVGIRSPYFRVLGIKVDSDGTGRGGSTPITPGDEEEFRRMANDPNIYETIAKSIAPSIYGSLDIKKAISCLLFGGSRKRMPDGLMRRGDVNLLMLGDPGTAKSQLLKFVERCSPIGVYTSGKGSSAAGLTASVIRDPQTRNFVMEGGAMVLADGGVVCIDEFDKMREDDRVAIHEAMEQQTISIAKAGITTTLNSRCSVLAAANSVYGRWDETKGEENIDFMPTILSRFDMIFIVKDEHNESRDMTLAKHVMNVHLNALQMTEEQAEGEIDLNTLKKYIQYCRSKCGPRLSPEAAEKLKNRYVLMRNGAGEYERETGKKITIPITVRQLEAIIRMSESLAKMKLKPFASEREVDEALRLFQVSTLDAAMSGNLSEYRATSTSLSEEILAKLPTTKRKKISLDSSLQPPKPVITEEKLGLLWPQPQSIIQRDGKPFTLGSQLPVYISTGPNESSKEVQKIWQTRKPTFEMLGLSVAVSVHTQLSDSSVPHVLCCVNSRVCPGCAIYKLTISSNQLKIVCSDIASLHYAIATVFQLFSLYKDEEIHVPPLLIDDWPDIHYRGILLDISQGRLLMKNSLKSTIETLSLNKINMIQLYCRFSNKDEPEWQAPYSKNCICELDDYCNERGIQVVPVLDVSPQIQFEDLDDLYSTLQDFIANFQNAQFVSLGPRLSSFVLDTDDGSLDTSDSIKVLPLSGDKTIQICGYPLHGMDTKLLFGIPPNVLISEYGIEADYEFRRFCTPLSEKGVGFFLCPGTSAWNSIAGCPEAAIKNIYNAVKCGVTHGCTGIVACDWSGKAHLNSHVFSWPAYMLNLGLSWNSNCHQDFLFATLGELMNRHVFYDKKSIAGQAVVELGRAETYLIRCSRAQAAGDIQRLPDALGSTLFKFLIAPDTVSIEHLSIEAVQRTVRHVKKCQQELANTDLMCQDGEEIKSELNLACELMLLATRICRSLLITGKNPSGTAGYAAINLGINNLSATVKTDIANRILEFMEPYKAAWNTRYMSSIGLQESLGTFQNLLRSLLPNQDTAELMNREHSSIQNI